MLVAIYFLTTSPDQSEEFNYLLQSIIGRTQFVPGCLKCSCWNSAEEPGNFLMMEEWESPEVLKQHFSSPVFHKLLMAMEICITRPDVRFINATSSKDFRWVQKILNGNFSGESKERR